MFDGSFGVVYLLQRLGCYKTLLRVSFTCPVFWRTFLTVNGAENKSLHRKLGVTSPSDGLSPQSNSPLFSGSCPNYLPRLPRWPHFPPKNVPGQWRFVVSEKLANTWRRQGIGSTLHHLPQHPPSYPPSSTIRTGCTCGLWGVGWESVVVYSPDHCLPLLTSPLTTLPPILTLARFLFSSQPRWRERAGCLARWGPARCAAGRVSRTYHAAGVELGKKAGIKVRNKNPPLWCNPVKNLLIRNLLFLSTPTLR